METKSNISRREFLSTLHPVEGYNKEDDIISRDDGKYVTVFGDREKDTEQYFIFIVKNKKITDHYPVEVEDITLSDLEDSSNALGINLDNFFSQEKARIWIHSFLGRPDMHINGLSASSLQFLLTVLCKTTSYPLHRLFYNRYGLNKWTILFFLHSIKAGVLPWKFLEE